MDGGALKEPGKGSDERGRKGKEWRTQHSSLGVFFFFGYCISLLGWSRSWSWKWEWGFGLFPFFSFGANYLPSYPSLGHTSHRWVGSRVDGRRCPSFLPGWLSSVVHPSADAAPVHTTDIPCTLPVLFSLVLWPVLFFLGWVGVRYLSVTVPYAPNLPMYIPGVVNLRFAEEYLDLVYSP